MDPARTRGNICFIWNVVSCEFCHHRARCMHPQALAALLHAYPTGVQPAILPKLSGRRSRCSSRPRKCHEAEIGTQRLASAEPAYLNPPFPAGWSAGLATFALLACTAPAPDMFVKFAKFARTTSQRPKPPASVCIQYA